MGVRSINPHLCLVGRFQCQLQQWVSGPPIAIYARQLNQYFTQLTEPLHTEGPEMVFSKTEEEPVVVRKLLKFPISKG